MNTDYQVAIPSYLRPGMLDERTLPFLINGGVPTNRITVFTHNHDPHLDAYKTITHHHNIRLETTSAHGITQQRDRILHHYPAGTDLIQTDDDVTAVKQATTPKTLTTIHDINTFFTHMFTELHHRDLYVWGLAPVANAFYMTPGQLSERLKFLIFSLWGCTTRPGHPVHTSTVPTKDDYELSIRAWWYDGAVLRNDGAAAIADIYKAPGGCQQTRTVTQAHQAVNTLIQQWPGLIRPNPRRHSTYPEILLATRKRHPGHPPTTPPPGTTPQEPDHG